LSLTRAFLICSLTKAFLFKRGKLKPEDAGAPNRFRFKTWVQPREFERAAYDAQYWLDASSCKSSQVGFAAKSQQAWRMFPAVKASRLARTGLSICRNQTG
jgi:hypothetical protein